MMTKSNLTVFIIFNIKCYIYLYPAPTRRVESPVFGEGDFIVESPAAEASTPKNTLPGADMSYKAMNSKYKLLLY